MRRAAVLKVIDSVWSVYVGAVGSVYVCWGRIHYSGEPNANISIQVLALSHRAQVLF